MSNHVHVIAVPAVPDGLALAFSNAHGRYAAYWNAIHGASGHAWQGRFYSCPLDEGHLWDCWGREEGDRCVIELSGLPAHGYDESKKQKIDLFESGEFEALREQRIVTIRNRLLDHKPKLA